ncbi:hypothetical protein D3C85_1658600 [compost metagenome]
MRTVEQTRIYRVDFFGDGHIEVAYSQNGKVMGFTSRNVNQTLAKDNEVIVSRGNSASGQVH